jgi:putative Mn2+ efflux pump MntP
MPIWQVLILAVGLGTDAFSVALAVGTGGASFRQTFRLSLHFGLFQFLMPILGWQAGTRLLSLISAWDHWIAFGILAAVGAHMIYESFKPESERSGGDPTRGWSLMLLSLATSIDAFGAGLGLGVLGFGVVLPSVIIGIVAGLMTVAGMQLGRRVSCTLGRRAETVGGVVLIALAFKLLSI